MADINSNDGPPSPPHSPPLNNDDPMDIDDDTVTSDELEIDISDFHMLGWPKEEFDALIAEVDVLVQNNGSTPALSTGGNSTSSSSELSTTSALGAGGNLPSSSSTPSVQCFAVKANDTTKSAIFFDEDSAQLYVSSLLDQERGGAMITPFRDVVSAYKFLHPLPAAHPIQPINIGLFRGGK